MSPLRQAKHKPEPESVHEHHWQNGPTTLRAGVSASPCSDWDDHLWDDVILTQTCGCGDTRRLLIGFKNQRRRGDDYRRAAGNRPLGTPLPTSGTYRKPKVIG